MADHGEGQHRDRGLHLHRNKDKKEDVIVQTTHVQTSSTYTGGNPAEAKKHAHMEHIAEAGVMLGGAMAMYEKHQAKKHPENANAHKVGQAVAAAMVAGSTVYVKQEHDAKKHEKEQGKHHLFGHHSHK